MKATGRSVLNCHKQIRDTKILDSFTVVVPTAQKQEYVAKYESMGYTVNK